MRFRFALVAACLLLVCFVHNSFAQNGRATTKSPIDDAFSPSATVNATSATRTGYAPARRPACGYGSPTKLPTTIPFVSCESTSAEAPTLLNCWAVSSVREPISSMRGGS